MIVTTTVLEGKAFIGGRPRERRAIPKDAPIVVPSLSALTLASQSKQKALKERGEIYNRFDDP